MESCVAGAPAALTANRTSQAPPVLAHLDRARHVPTGVDLERCAGEGASSMRTGLLGGRALGFGEPAPCCSGAATSR